MTCPCLVFVRQVYRYLPLIPQLAALYGRADIARYLHHDITTVNWDDADRVQEDIQQSDGWREVMRNNSWGTHDNRTLMLSLCADGINPFNSSYSTYSMCPIMMTVLNLPEHLRYNPANMLLIGVVPGPFSPRIMAPYLDPLVDELILLKRPGVSVVDASRNNETFTLRARLMTVVADYPGHGQLMEMKHSGYFACNKCMVEVSIHTHAHIIIHNIILM